VLFCGLQLVLLGFVSLIHCGLHEIEALVKICKEVFVGVEERIDFGCSFFLFAA
jgi:hypothetical protein